MISLLFRNCRCTNRSSEGTGNLKGFSRSLRLSLRLAAGGDYSSFCFYLCHKSYAPVNMVFMLIKSYRIKCGNESWILHWWKNYKFFPCSLTILPLSEITISRLRSFLDWINLLCTKSKPFKIFSLTLLFFLVMLR